MYVLTAVSSINTSRAGSSMRRRARATSARCRSAACRLFLRVMLCRSKKRQSELRLVRIRRLRSSIVTLPHPEHLFVEEFRVRPPV
jgi:hypothetical protein